MFLGTLREYQAESVERMVDRGQMLLGMVMGSGKTPTTLAAIEQLVEEGEVERCLIVVPASLKYQWVKEIHKFTDGKVTIIDGSPAKRAKQWRHSMSSLYVVVNAETLRNDTKLAGTYQCIVIDEATSIKSRVAKRTRMMKKVGRAVPYRFALTGQPIENRPEELFSIMEFVDKQVLGTFEEFDRTFIVRDSWGKPKRFRNLDIMHKAMQECMVRLTRADIEDELPDIERCIIPVAFDAKGARTYRAITADLLDQIKNAIKFGGGGFNLWSHYNDPEGNEAQGQVMARLTALRMLCDNPALVTESGKKYVDPNTKAGSAYADEIMHKGWMTGVTAAPKLDACMEYIREVLAEDPKNKVVLFSFFKANLRMIQDTLAKAKKGQVSYGSVRFDGDMNAKQKDQAKEKFEQDPKCRVFLSSDAGGYGVDLPNANYLISFDLPWSSGKLEQREARIIRLSSEFDKVTLVTFLMQGSIEERQYEMLQEKLKTNEAFIDGKHHDVDKGLDITLASLTDFLESSKV